MRRFIKILYFGLLIPAFVTFLALNQTFAAGVVDTPHDMSNTNAQVERCSTCHIPHKSIGYGLWFIPDRGIGIEGEVGNLCFACHSSTGYGSTLLTEASFSEKYVFPGVGTGKHSHGLIAEGHYKDVASTDLDLPYTPGTEFQCTTCHNVHDNHKNRPFLRDNIKILCVICHKVNKTHTGGVEAKIIKDDDDTILSLIWTEGSSIKEAFFRLLPFDDPDGATDASWGDGKGRWNLGLHLAADVEKDGVPGNGTDGGVTCVTCHAVHGVQDDSDANTPIDIPREKLIPKFR